MEPLPTPSRVAVPNPERSNPLQAYQGQSGAAVNLSDRRIMMGPATIEALLRLRVRQDVTVPPLAPTAFMQNRGGISSQPEASLASTATRGEVTSRMPTWMERVDQQYELYCRVNPGTAVTLNDFRQASWCGGGAPGNTFRVENLPKSPEELETISEEGSSETPAPGRRRAFSSVLTAQRPPPDDEAVVRRLNRLLLMTMSITVPASPPPPEKLVKRYRRHEAIQMELHRQGFTVANPSSKLRRTLRREAIFGKPNHAYDGKPLPGGRPLPRGDGAK